LLFSEGPAAHIILDTLSYFSAEFTYHDRGYLASYFYYGSFLGQMQDKSVYFLQKSEARLVELTQSEGQK